MIVKIIHTHLKLLSLSWNAILEYFQLVLWHVSFFWGQETKAEIITRENKKRLLAKEEEKEEKKWSVLSFSIEEEMKEDLNSGIKNLEDFLKSCKSSSVKFRVEMVGLTACLKAWKEYCQSEGMWLCAFICLIYWRSSKNVMLVGVVYLLEICVRSLRCMTWSCLCRMPLSVITSILSVRVKSPRAREQT